MNTQDSSFAPRTVCYYIDSLASGGAERQIAILAAAMSRTGVHVHVVCNRLEGIYGHYLDLFKGTSVVVHSLGKHTLAAGAAFVKKHPDRFQVWRNCHGLRWNSMLFLGSLINIAPDILHCYLDVPNCAGGYAGLMAGIPGIVLSCRSMDPITVEIAALAKLSPMYQFLNSHPAIRLEANSAKGAAAYAKWLNIPVTDIGVNPNGIDPDRYTASNISRRSHMRHLLGIDNAAPVVLFLSRDVPQKRASDMAAVVALLRETMPDMRLLAAGRGLAEDEPFGIYLQKQGISNSICLLGVRKDIPDLLTAADALLLTSQVEGFPNAIMEAMCAGLPVVATTAGGVPDLVVHGETGYLHAVGDVQGMAKSLARLLGDPKLCNQMGTQGYERIRNNFTEEKLTERTLRSYAALLARDSGNRDSQ